MRIAIVHDDLVQWGGAERVLLGICDIFPGAPIFTSLFDVSNPVLKQNFGTKKIFTSFLQKLPGWRKMYKALLPFYPIAFEQFNFDQYDLVISNVTRFAKSVITKPGTTHISYCHTPPRFLWHFSGENPPDFLEPLLTKLRFYDQISSRRVDVFIAGSLNAARRIKKIYRRESKVIYPFVDLKRFEHIDPYDGGYFLAVGRPNKYKKFDLAQLACDRVGVELKIISGNLSEEISAAVIAGAKALIIPGIEDFGIACLEAQSLGKPVIAFRGGGVTETVIEGVSGIFFDEQSVESLSRALEEFGRRDSWNRKAIIEHAHKFSQENFTRSFEQAIATL